MGRKRNPNSRRSMAEKRRRALALQNRVEAPDYILERRKLFSFVTPTKGPDGRVGEIDQDICDPIGQLHAVGKLDNPWHDATELRDKGRFWGCHYVKVMKSVGVKMGAYERADKGKGSDALTGADLLFDRMDENLQPYERQVLLSLIVDPMLGHDEDCLWALAHICEELWQRGKVPPVRVFKTAHHDALLDSAIRGLCQLVDVTERRMAA
jgi:hypothetical protein